MFQPDKSTTLNWTHFLELLEARTAHPLPGADAQYKMAHVGRGFRSDPPPTARDASVLLLIYPYLEEAHTVFIQRTGHLESDRHKGQISFPGGKKEDSDNDFSESALRETEEEIGIPRSMVQLVRPMTPLYIPVSNFLVHPFLGIVREKPVFIPQPSEVADILEVPLARFFKPESVKKTDISIHEGLILRDVPYFDLDGRVLWGATAMIISEFLEWWQMAQPKDESLSL